MNKKEIAGSGTFGVGYATVIMIFVVICLSIMALLSYNAAGINESLAQNNSTYITSYYSAEERVTNRICELDGIALSALQSPFFEDSFEYAVSELGDVGYTRIMEGYSVSFSEEINDRLALFVTMDFYSDPSLHGGRRYSITEYMTAGISDTDGPTLNLWDGSAPEGYSE